MSGMSSIDLTSPQYHDAVGDKDQDSNVYILGRGTIGKFIGHALAGRQNRGRITFLSHRNILQNAYIKGGHQLTLVNGEDEVGRSGFAFERFSRSRSRTNKPRSIKDKLRNESKNDTDQTRSIEEESEDTLEDEPDQIRSIEGESEDALEEDTDQKRGIEENLGNTLEDHVSSSKASEGRESTEEVNSADDKPDGYPDWSPRWTPKTPIRMLIVDRKSFHAYKDLHSIRHRLGKDSTILFLRAGMGVIEDIDKHLFTNPDNKPTYLEASVSHGIRSQAENRIVYGNHGHIALGLSPLSAKAHGLQDSQIGDLQMPSARCLIDMLTTTSELAALEYGPTELFVKRLEKLVVFSIINPLTLMLGCRNGDIIYNFQARRAMRLLLAETSLVIRRLPELQAIHFPAHARFAPARLENLVVKYAKSHPSTISAALQDSRAGVKQEIDYYNGYIVRRGEELGLHCVMNYMMTKLVHAKGQFYTRVLDGHIPEEAVKDREGHESFDEDESLSID